MGSNHELGRFAVVRRCKHIRLWTLEGMVERTTK